MSVRAPSCRRGLRDDARVWPADARWWWCGWDDMGGRRRPGRERLERTSRVWALLSEEDDEGWSGGREKLTRREAAAGRQSGEGRVSMRRSSAATFVASVAPGQRLTTWVASGGQGWSVPPEVKGEAVCCGALVVAVRANRRTGGRPAAAAPPSCACQMRRRRPIAHHPRRPCDGAIDNPLDMRDSTLEPATRTPAALTAREAVLARSERSRRVIQLRRSRDCARAGTGPTDWGRPGGWTGGT